MKKQILVLGSVNADHVVRMDHFPRPGETITGSSYNIISGGKGANQAVACARLGGETAFMSCVGNDPFGQQIFKQLAADGINIAPSAQIEGVNTGVALIFVDKHAENCIAIAAEANNHVDEAYIEAHQLAIAEADYLLTQLETPVAGITLAAQIARANGTKVVLNPAPARPLDDELLSNVDIITPNQTEAEALTGIAVTDEASAEQAANALHQKGIETVVITMGKLGAFFSEAGVQKMVPSFRVEAIDTTAAGDTFNGGMLVALAEGLSIEQALIFANACGALSVQREGAQTSIPTRAEVDAFLSAAQ